MAHGVQVGDTVKGSQFYGKKNTLLGIITKIEEVTYAPQPFYRGNDIVTVEWDDGTVVRFHREIIHVWGKEARE